MPNGRWAAPSSMPCWASVVSGRGFSSGGKRRCRRGDERALPEQTRTRRVFWAPFGAVALVSIWCGPKSILDLLRAIARFAGRHTGLRQIDGVTLQIRELAILQRGFVGRAKHHARRLSCFERFLPARRAETPAVAGFKSRKAEFRHRR
jgi:hypothetical protein